MNFGHLVKYIKKFRYMIFFWSTETLPHMDYRAVYHFSREEAWKHYPTSPLLFQPVTSQKSCWAHLCLILEALVIFLTFKRESSLSHTSLLYILYFTLSSLLFLIIMLFPLIVFLPAIYLSFTEPLSLCFFSMPLTLVWLSTTLTAICLCENPTRFSMHIL